jgi:hypothetical protein
MAQVPCWRQSTDRRRTVANRLSIQYARPSKAIIQRTVEDTMLCGGTIVKRIILNEYVNPEKKTIGRFEANGTSCGMSTFRVPWAKNKAVLTTTVSARLRPPKKYRWRNHSDLAMLLLLFCSRCCSCCCSAVAELSMYFMAFASCSIDVGGAELLLERILSAALRWFCHSSHLRSLGFCGSGRPFFAFFVGDPPMSECRLSTILIAVHGHQNLKTRSLTTRVDLFTAFSCSLFFLPVCIKVGRPA